MTETAPALDRVVKARCRYSSATAPKKQIIFTKIFHFNAIQTMNPTTENIPSITTHSGQLILHRVLVEITGAS